MNSVSKQDASLEARVLELRQEAIENIQGAAADIQAAKQELDSSRTRFEAQVRLGFLIGLTRGEIAEAGKVSESLVGTMLRDKGESNGKAKKPAPAGKHVSHNADAAITIVGDEDSLE